MSTDRRRLLGLVAAAPAALLFARSASAAGCADVESLTTAQKSMRKSLGFKNPAPDPARACGGCAFYTAGAQGCGKCTLMSGGPVPADGTCNSFAKKG